jgi:FHS family L-fucose permease-like MFS transporter
MAIQMQETHTHADEKPFAKQYELFHASFAHFCYTGAQVAITSMFINYATEMRSNTDKSLGAKFFASAQAAFTRFTYHILRYSWK